MQLIGVANYMYAGESCYICHRNECIVDTGTYIEGEGALGICCHCIKELARTAGYGRMIENEAELQEALSQADEARERAVEAESRAKVLADRLASIQVEWVNAVESVEAVQS